MDRKYKKGDMMSGFDINNQNQHLSRHSSNLKNYYNNKERILETLNKDKLPITGTQSQLSVIRDSSKPFFQDRAAS